jgi:hypothetical protein
MVCVSVKRISFYFVAHLLDGGESGKCNIKIIEMATPSKIMKGQLPPPAGMYIK